MALIDVLRRFRPAGAPGSAGPVGVPSDGHDKAAAELAPVFAELTLVVEQADAIRARADAAGTERITTAERDAAAIVGRASSAALVARAEAASTVRADGHLAATRLLTDADTQIDHLRAHGASALDELVSKAVALVRADLLGTDAAQPGTGSER